MDDRSQPGVPQFGADKSQQVDPVQGTNHQAVAPPPSSKDTRVGDVPLTTDGQLIEAGYGHGV